MAYIYRKMVGGKPYYYLRVSKRKDGKQVVKDIAYLGSDPQAVKRKLKEIEHNPEVRKAHKSISKFLESNYYLAKAREKKLKHDIYLPRDLLEQIEAVRLHYTTHFLNLDPLTMEETYKHFLIDFAFNTTSLEGNTITLAEAQRLLEDEIVPKDRSVREVHDLQNTQEVFFQVLRKQPPITQDTIRDVHDRLLERIDSRTGYRTHEIRVFKSAFEATPVQYIAADMGLLLQWYKSNERSLHPLVLAAVFHHKLEKIHPFADGNGRTGRMLMNVMLIKRRYPPMIIPKKKRAAYLNALRKADKEPLDRADPVAYKELTAFVAEEFISSYWNNFNV